METLADGDPSNPMACLEQSPSQEGEQGQSPVNPMACIVSHRDCQHSP